MSISHEFDYTTGVVRIVYKGRPTLEDQISHMLALTEDPGIAQPLRLLVDRRDVEELAGAPEAQLAVDRARDALDRVAGARIAIVVSRPGAFGMARLFQTLAEEVFEVRPFYDQAEAERWLAGAGTSL